MELKTRDASDGQLDRLSGEHLDLLPTCESMREAITQLGAAVCVEFVPRKLFSIQKGFSSLLMRYSTIIFYNQISLKFTWKSYLARWIV